MLSQLRLKRLGATWARFCLSCARLCFACAGSPPLSVFPCCFAEINSPGMTVLVGPTVQDTLIDDCSELTDLGVLIQFGQVYRAMSAGVAFEPIEASLNTDQNPKHFIFNGGQNSILCSKIFRLCR